MFYFDWRLALVVVTGAPLVVYPLVRLGQRVRRSTRRSQEAARAPVASHRRGVHRPPDREGVRRRAHEAARFGAASERLYRTNLKITSTVSLLPPMMEFLGGVAIVGLLWYGQPQIAPAALTTRATSSRSSSRRSCSTRRSSA